MAPAIVANKRFLIWENAGLFGARWRVKYTTVGTYAGGTRLEIDVYTERQAV